MDIDRTKAHPVSETAAAVLAIASAMLLLPGLARSNAAPPGANEPARATGIWKAVVPPTLMKGEFDSMDPLGVAAGARIKADCSLNWIDPDNGARYCFSSGTSLEYFLDHPKVSIERAKRGWERLRAGSSPNAE